MNRKISDVIIHTRNRLSDHQFAAVSESVYRDEAVVSFSRSDQAPQCLMVVYNGDKTEASSILKRVTNSGISASLVGI